MSYDVGINFAGFKLHNINTTIIDVIGVGGWFLGPDSLHFTVK